MASEALKIEKGREQPEASEKPVKKGGQRAWESFREQAYLWRALSLLQMPATALSMAATLVMYFYADTIINVHDRPQTGYHPVSELPNSQFADVATTVVNLIGTYQPAIARRQFKTALRYLAEPALSTFEETAMGRDIAEIEETRRSQIFFSQSMDFQRDNDKVYIRIPGVRQKMVGPKRLPPDQIAYFVTMTTVPQNVTNEYGIVVIDVHTGRPDDDGGENKQQKKPAGKPAGQKDGGENKAAQ